MSDMHATAVYTYMCMKQTMLADMVCHDHFRPAFQCGRALRRAMHMSYLYKLTNSECEKFHTCTLE